MTEQHLDDANPAGYRAKPPKASVAATLGSLAIGAARPAILAVACMRLHPGTRPRATFPGPPRMGRRCVEMLQYVNLKYEAAAKLLIPGGKLFLAAIVDLFSRSVGGWALSPADDRHLTVPALDMALHRRCTESGLHHSDRGSAFVAEDRGLPGEYSGRGEPELLLDQFESVFRAFRSNIGHEGARRVAVDR